MRDLELFEAIDGPVTGSRPSAFNMLARARWDAWAKLLLGGDGPLESPQARQRNLKKSKEI